MEYTQIVRATQAQFEQEDRDIEARQAEVDGAQALLDRRRKALKRKKGGSRHMGNSRKWGEDAVGLRGRLLVSAFV